MGGEEDGAAPAANITHHFLEDMGGLGVQAHKRLVHEDQLRLMKPGGNDGQLLLHTVGIGADGLVQAGCQLEGLRQLIDPLGPLLGGDPKDIRHKIQVLDAGHKIVEVRVIRDVGHLLFAGQGVSLDGHPVHQNLAAVKLQDARHAFQGGGFARAVMSDKAVYLSGVNVQRQIVHSLLVAVGL